MNNRLFCLAFLWLPIILSAQTATDYQALDIPEALRAGANEVVRYENLEIEARSDRDGIIRYHGIITILNSDSKAFEIVVPYSGDSKVNKLKGTLYDKLGNEIRRAGKSDIQDFAWVSSGTFYEDDRYELLRLRHHQYPYTVEFSYERKIRDFEFANLPDWQIVDYAQSCAYRRYAITLPKDNQLHFKALNTDLQPTIRSNSKTQTWEWEARSVPAIEPEPFAPSRTEVLPQVLVALDQFTIEGYAGSMRSWTAFGQFIHTLFDGRADLPPAVRGEIRTICSGLADPQAKVDRLYDYLQERMRYVSVQLGIGGWQPFDAEYVAKNRYGDCKALTNYMRALLAEVGIESYPVLIFAGSPSWYYPIDPSFATSAFNHVILYIPQIDRWLECTSNTAPPGYLGGGTSGRKGLMVTANGGIIVETPASDNSQRRHTKVTLRSDGSATIDSKCLQTGTDHDRMRELHANYSRQDQLEVLADYQYLPDAQPTQFELEAAPAAPRARISYSDELPRYARRMGIRIFVPLYQHEAMVEVPPLDADRQLPIHFPLAHTYIDTVTVSIPEGYEIESLGDPTLEYASKVGTYHSAVTLEGDQLRWIRTLQWQPARLAASEYEAFRQFFIDIGKAETRRVVLRGKRT